MKNEVLIHVRAVNDTKAVFDLIRADAHNLGDTVAIKVNKTITERIERDTKAAASGSGAYARVGDEIGRTMGEHISERINEKVNVKITERLRGVRDRFFGGGRERVSVDTHEHVSVDVDVDKRSFLQQIGALGGDVKDKIAGFFSEGATGGLSSVFSGDILSSMIKPALLTLAAGTLAPLIGGVITSGILLALGGGVLGVGIAAALKSHTVKGAFADLKKSVTGLFGASGTGTGKKKTEDTFGTFGSYFTGPVTDFVSMLSKLLDQLKPTINDIGRTFGPVADVLAHGIIGFLQNAVPGIARATKSAEPLIKTLADELPGIGDAIGKFFDHIKNGAPDANIFFNDLLNIIPPIIKIIGILIEAFAKTYTIFRTLFLAMVGIAADWAVGITSAARVAFGWVPGLGPKLDSAAHKAAKFKSDVNKQLNGIHDVDINVRLKVWGMNTMNAALDVVHALGKFGAAHKGKATGGVIGMAASGGARSGLTWVGENGPELIDAAPGSQVYSNSDSMRMAGQGGGGWGGRIEVPVYLDGRQIARAMADPMRDLVRNQHGGSVQAAYGV